MLDIILVLISTCLVNNLILDGMLGIAPAMSTLKKIEVARGMSITMIFVLSVAGPVAYLIKYYFLIPRGFLYLELLSFILVISLSVLLVLKVLTKFKPALSQEVAFFLPLMLMNTAVLGAAMLAVQNNHGLITSLIFGIGSAFGFSIVLLIISAIQERVVVANVPTPFKGASIMLITLGMLSMAFMGFVGIGI